MARTLLRAALGATLRAALLGTAAIPVATLAVFPVRAGDAALDDLTLRFGSTLVKVPHLELRGTGLSQDELRAILDPAGTEPWASRLKRLSGDTLAIPALRVEQAVADQVQVVVYRDVLARRIVEGKIGSLEAAGAVLTLEGSGKPGAGAYGHMAASDLDLTGLARLLTERGGPDAPAIRVYGAVTMDDVALTGAKGETFRIGHLEGRDFGGRPTATPWGETAALLAAGDPAKAPPDQRGRIAGLAADLLDAVTIGPFELRDISATDPGDGKPTRVALTRLSFAPENGAGTLRSEGWAVEGPALKAALRTLSLSGMSLKPTVEGLRRGAVEAIDPAELRRYAPLLGRVALDGLQIDLPATPSDDPAAPEPPLHVDLRNIALDMSAVRDGVPTTARLTLDGLAFPVPANAPALAPLAALGYKAVDLSGVLDSSWNEEQREVAIRELSLSGKDMGNAKLTATLGGIGREIFNPDVAVSSLAMLSATAKALALTVENGGLFERFVADQAKAQSLKPAELQKEYSTAAQLGIPAVLGNSASAKALGQAVARFVTKPGRLTVTAAAKNPAGLGVLDVSGAPSPGKVFDRLNVTATAE
ncbi:hypothetical protein [Methylobacterium sp. JK268]